MGLYGLVGGLVLVLVFRFILSVYAVLGAGEV